jgi:hypothetical protein
MIWDFKMPGWKNSVQRLGIFLTLSAGGGCAARRVMQAGETAGGGASGRAGRLDRYFLTAPDTPQNLICAIPIYGLYMPYN